MIGECPLSHVWLSTGPMHLCPPGSSVHGIFWPRILEWVAMPTSRGSSQSRDWTVSLVSPALAGDSLPLVWPKKPEVTGKRGRNSQVYVPELFRMRKEQGEWENKEGNWRSQMLGSAVSCGLTGEVIWSGTDRVRRWKLLDHSFIFLGFLFIPWGKLEI